MVVAINAKNLGGPSLTVTPVNQPNPAAVPTPLGTAPAGSGAGKTESSPVSPDKSGKTPAPGAAEKSAEKAAKGSEPASQPAEKGGSPTLPAGPMAPAPQK